MTSRVLLLSVHPKHSNNIFDGSKSVELRRTRPKIKHGDVIIVYASSPEKSISGIVTVEKVIERQLDELWSEVYDKAGISHQQFLSYFSGAKKGCAIYLNREFECPPKHIGLDELRQVWKGFHPPQSYRYLKQNEIEIFDNLFKFDVRQFSGNYQCSLFLNC